MWTFLKWLAKAMQAHRASLSRDHIELDKVVQFLAINSVFLFLKFQCIEKQFSREKQFPSCSGILCPFVKELYGLYFCILNAAFAFVSCPLAQKNGDQILNPLADWLYRVRPPRQLSMLALKIDQRFIVSGHYQV